MQREDVIAVGTRCGQSGKVTRGRGTLQIRTPDQLVEGRQCRWQLGNARHPAIDDGNERAVPAHVGSVAKPEFPFEIRHAVMLHYPGLDEIYDLERDPLELENVAGREDTRALHAELSAQLLRLVGESLSL